MHVFISVSWVYMYDFMPVPYSLDNYSFNLKGFFFLKKKKAITSKAGRNSSNRHVSSPGLHRWDTGEFLAICGDLFMTNLSSKQWLPQHADSYRPLSCLYLVNHSTVFKCLLLIRNLILK